ncbi:MAG: hypothetical protein MJ071_07665 [Oscillospiraceae bacterium]|nr:hypothetical protein [Oscillospiraceae bacterium]
MKLLKGYGIIIKYRFTGMQQHLQKKTVGAGTVRRAAADRKNKSRSDRNGIFQSDILISLSARMFVMLRAFSVSSGEKCRADAVFPGVLCMG